MKNKSRTGSLMVTMLFVFALVVVVGAILSMSLNTFRLSMRNEFRAQARAVGESELEHMYYLFRNQIESGVLPAGVPASLSTKGVDAAAFPTSATYDAHLQAHREEGWKVKRSMIVPQSFPGVDSDGNSAIVTYADVKIEVVPPAGNPWTGGPAVRYGRQFEVVVATIFQNCIFYQDDLEMSPGEDTDVEGDVACNGNIFLSAAKADKTVDPNKLDPKLTIMRMIKVFGGFNSAGVGVDGKYGMDPGLDKDFATLIGNSGDDVDFLTTFLNPIVSTDNSKKVAPVFKFGAGEQLKWLEEPVNLMGGKDPQAIFDYDTTLGNLPNLVPTLNDVYRSLIVPPPVLVRKDASGNPVSTEYPGGTNEYPTRPSADDETLGAQRLYNRAGLIVTVEADAAAPNGLSYSVTKPDGTTVSGFADAISTEQMLKKDASGNPIIRRDASNNPVQAKNPDGTPKVDGNGAPVYALEEWGSGELQDLREDKRIKVTNINLGELRKLVGTTGSLLGTDFNGLLYVNLKVPNAAVRLVNAEITPRTGKDGTDGFSVVTNGGLYVQGSYNTKDTSGVTLTGSSPRSMLLADALTVLSEDWLDENSLEEVVGTNAVERMANRKAAHNLEINAGLLCGNTASTTGVASGGAQNLVRFLENWDSNEVVFNGSLGQLFHSKFFNARFYNPGRGPRNDVAPVYITPKKRIFRFDSGLTAGGGPPGSPKSTGISRGRYYFW